MELQKQRKRFHTLSALIDVIKLFFLVTNALMMPFKHSPIFENNTKERTCVEKNAPL
jgi:hypothetical protein